MAKTIIVLDDEMLIALDIQTQLEEVGHKVLTASTTKEAIALVDTEPVDLAIADWHLRGEVSAPFIEMLKQRGIPFVLCSGSALEELAGVFPATPTVPKPFATADLLAAVAQAIDGRPVQ